ncbi:hypothetical protein C1645_777565 [Glomus cerebriforme]|uniref:Uncharacterized protein n=1 Tax=Glomus cerebriforme TaxID=658196 RepID=A0A397SRS1_9GLOM|nr:hypothetical protein C1645_777565 [Glomus cerebriforme]
MLVRAPGFGPSSKEFKRIKRPTQPKEPKGLLKTFMDLEKIFIYINNHKGNNNYMRFFVIGF